MSYSELAQINSILHSTLGVVLERYVLAKVGDTSFNVFRGLESRESLASFVGLFWGRADELPGVVACMMSYLA